MPAQRIALKTWLSLYSRLQNVQAHLDHQQRGAQQ
jgi:hypothetical protein